jgi:ATP-dependent exoDNAse (exonuclease V) beta subunit
VFARDRRLLILGRADLVFEEADGGGLTVVDFKTDQVPEEWSEGDLRAYAVRHGYAGQVEAYRRAMQLATGRTVDHAFVLFLRPGRAVEFLPGTIGSWADSESLLTGPQQPA